ncbi:adenine deaminase, partial [bacterium]|nr:adenine deaminase [bacterium]
DLGAIAPGYKADLLILPDLKTFKPNFVLKNGEVIVENGKLTAQIDDSETPSVRGSVNVKWIEEDDFKIEASSDMVKTIEVIPHQLVTKSVVSQVKIENGNAISNIDTDTLKICVIERHRATGNIGKGFVKGFNLKSGAIASTVAHDSHNMIIVGTNDYDMYVAAVELVKSQGGKVVVRDGEVISKLPLPIAGLMSDKEFDYVLSKCDELNKAAHLIGCTLEDPFMTMGFLSLPVIPELKITDKGIFDTNKFDFVDIFEESRLAKL